MGFDSESSASVSCRQLFSNDKFAGPKMTCRLILILALLSFVITAWANLEQVTDADLEKLIANEKFVVTLFRGRKSTSSK